MYQYFRAYAAYEDGIAVSPELEHENRKILGEYVAKFNIPGYTITDPLEIKRSEWLSEDSGGREKWPSMYYHDIAKYLDHLSPVFLGLLESEYKLGKAYRYFCCDFVREVLYLNLNNDLCIMKCKVIPSQRTSDKPYDVWAIVRQDKPDKPGGEILSAYCTCTAGLQGSCNHIVAMCFRIEAAVAQGYTRPSKTSTSCQWVIPSGNKVNLKPTKAEELYFCKNKYTRSKSVEEKQKDARKKFQSYKPSLHPKHQKEIKNVAQIRAELFAILEPDIKSSCLAEVMRGKRGGIKKTEVPLPPSIPTILSTHDLNSDPLSKLVLTEAQCEAIEKATRDQSINPVWHEQRKGRITASKFYKVCTRTETAFKKSIDANCLVKDIMGLTKKVSTIGMKHGLATEPHAKRKLVEIVKSLKHKQVVVQDTGLIINPKYPHLGASPDMIVSCSCHGKFVVEIKCPEKIKDTKPSVANLDYLTCDDKTVRLKQRHDYYFQIQGQMGITGVEQAIFFVFTHHGHYVEMIEFDSALWEQMLYKFNYFWYKYVAPHICIKGTTVSNVPKSSASLNTKPITELLSDASINDENAPTNLLCGTCLKIIVEQPKSPDDYSSVCDHCKQWYHNTCANIKDEDFYNNNFIWTCSLCPPPIDFAIHR